MQILRELEYKHRQVLLRNNYFLTVDNDRAVS